MRLVLGQVIIAGNAFRDRFENPFSIKSLLLFGTLIALFIGIGLALNLAIKKQDEKTAQNLIEFFSDEILESKKLERTLSVALLAVAVVAISISLYFIWEPTRQAKMTTSFDERSVRRGQTLYANSAMEGYNNVESLQCANCHGGYDPDTGRYANGGTANFTLKSIKDPSTDEACAGDEKFRNPDCITTTVAWKAPALNTVLYKYPIRKSEAGDPFKSSCRLLDQRSTPDCRSQVYDILTYGRPGTPMPAWGVAGGGPKNEQAIQDLVNFLSYIQLPEDEASQPIRSGEIIKQKAKIKVAEEALKKAKEDAIATGMEPSKVASAEPVVAAEKTLATEKLALVSIEAKSETQYIREAAIAEAQESVNSAQKMVDEESPQGLASALQEYNNAVAKYNAEPLLKPFGNPQDYLDKLEKEQVDIKLEKEIEAAKIKGDKAKARKADAKLVEFNRLKEIAQNFVETRDAVATAKATNEIFAPASLSNAKARLTQLQNQSDGELLFESNCARCHTKGWSYFTPGNSRVPLPAAQGTGAFGPNLAGGDLKLQFPDAKDQATFIGNGSAFQAAYGVRGIGTGRMPGYNSVAGNVLTPEQIDAIVEYERNGLNAKAENSLGVPKVGSSKNTTSTKQGK